MASPLITAEDQTTCTHDGQAKPTTVESKVCILGQPIVVLSATYTVSGCPASNPGPCATGKWMKGAQRILANGVPVVLANSPSISPQTGFPLKLQKTQSRVLGT